MSEEKAVPFHQQTCTKKCINEIVSSEDNDLEKIKKIFPFKAYCLYSLGDIFNTIPTEYDEYDINSMLTKLRQARHKLDILIDALEDFNSLRYDP